MFVQTCQGLRRSQPSKYWKLDFSREVEFYRTSENHPMTDNDPLRSGAIYQVKDMRPLKSPPSTKSAKIVANSQKRESLEELLTNGINKEEAKHIQERFTHTYRAIPSPSVQLFQQNVTTSRLSRSLLNGGENGRPLDVSSPSSINRLLGMSPGHRQLIENASSSRSKEGDRRK